MSRISPTLMVMAGGTGGHVFPAIAVADWLKTKGWNIAWLVTEGGMENQLITGKGYASSMIKMKGVRGKGIFRKLAAPFQVLFACQQSLQALRHHKPDVVLGMGGYAALPGGLMAWILRKPLVIHEQNSVAGLTNRVLSIFAKRVLAAFPSAFGDKATLVGNPVRADIAALPEPKQRFNNRDGALRVLVIGGSLGAQILNETVPQALSQLAVELRPQVIHQAGAKHIKQLQTHYQNANVSADARAFIDDMAVMYAWCDVVICRAGALTVAELAAAGVASILVPFPHAVDDHQTGNAKYLADNGAALLLPQSSLNASTLAKVIAGLTHESLLAMAIKARALGKPEATADVAQVCMELAK
ncbi:MAG: undecaprenyldiphospho-muramoylpentapeptide beta-N-acetylglucosaminyltransferase [Methylophilales bacterium]|nr:undecaprenyldiphospho-muramoylpentapeptide beta-N-acetylglucosaminyltransferase [Methylophilales bacterium]